MREQGRPAGRRDSGRRGGDREGQASDQRKRGNRPSYATGGRGATSNNRGGRGAGKPTSGRGERAPRGRDDFRREREHAPAPSVAEEQAVAPDLIKGRHPVATALLEGRPINKVLMAEGAESGLQHIVARAKEQGVVLQTVPKSRLDSLVTGNHQGVVAYVAPYEYVELEEIVAKDNGHASLIVVLDGVTDPHNLGAIIRTAEAAGAQGVVIGKHRAAPVTETVAKASAGALEYLPVARVANITTALETLKDEGYWVVGTSLDAEHPMADVDYKGKTVIVIGSEGVGLHRLVKERCDFLVSIPILGRVQSLNASVAAGVMLYEVVRQRT